MFDAGRLRLAVLVMLVLPALGCTRLTARPPGTVRQHDRRQVALPAAPDSVYAAARAGMFSPVVAGIPQRVYVPSEGSGTVEIIDPAALRVIGGFPVGRRPHHITPSWDLHWLYVNNTASGTLTRIDPLAQRPAGTLAVSDPYNLYFTPDGSRAVVVAERLQRLDFRDPSTFVLLGTVPIPWPGVDHLDFARDGQYLLASAEYSGVVVKVDLRSMVIAGVARVGGLPVDVRLAPAGDLFFVANQGRGGVSIIDPDAMREVGFLPTGSGAHGLAVSRDGTALYVANRLAGTISVIDPAARQVRATWPVGGSPDMMQVSPDGRRLWVSSRFHRAVIVVDTETGKNVAVIPVGVQPHGLTYFPQPGRFSLGHNGVYR